MSDFSSSAPTMPLVSAPEFLSTRQIKKRLKKLLDSSCFWRVRNDDISRALLYEFLVRGNAEVAEWLMTKQSPIFDGSDLFEIGVRDGNQSMIHFVLTHGDKMKFKNLGKLVRDDNLETLIRLDEHGIDLDIVGDDGETLVHTACLHEQHSILKFLLTKTNHIDADYDSVRPLFLACRVGSLECVQILIEHGADMNVKKEDGWTPLMTACANGHDSIVRYLMKFTAHGKAKSKGFQVLDIDASNGKKKTALYYAAHVNHLGIVKRLIRYRANARLASHRGNTPCDIARRKHNESIVHYLENRHGDRRKIRRLEKKVKALEAQLSTAQTNLQTEYLEISPSPLE